MKNIDYLLKKEPVFLECFNSQEDVASNFEVTLTEDVKILFAHYCTPCYDGYAYVLFTQNGKLYEVHGSHCSCYGLEGQWEPEECTIEDIEYRLMKGTLGQGDSKEESFSEELKAFLENKDGE